MLETHIFTLTLHASLVHRDPACKTASDLDRGPVWRLPPPLLYMVFLIPTFVIHAIPSHLLGAAAPSNPTSLAILVPWCPGLQGDSED